MTQIKKEIKARARLARGLTNGLEYDVDCLYSDVENFDVFCINESIKETKEAMKKLIDNLDELERLLYLIKVVKD